LIWKSWKDVNEVEMKAFLGVILNTHIRPQPNLQDFFSTTFTDSFRSIFKRDCFLQIYWKLHLQDNRESNHEETRINKANLYLRYLNERFRKHFIPGREIVVDQSTVYFKGKYV